MESINFNESLLTPNQKSEIQNVNGNSKYVIKKFCDKIKTIFCIKKKNLTQVK